MQTFLFNARTATTVVALSALLALGACGKKEDTTTMPATPANTAPSVTTPAPTPMPETTASGAMGSSSAPTSTMADPTMPASAASAAK